MVITIWYNSDCVRFSKSHLHCNLTHVNMYAVTISWHRNLEHLQENISMTRGYLREEDKTKQLHKLYFLSTRPPFFMKRVYILCLLLVLKKDINNLPCQSHVWIICKMSTCPNFKIWWITLYFIWAKCEL